MNFAWLTHSLLAAADPTGPVRSIEYDWPTATWQWALYLTVMAASLILVLFVYRRDTVEVHWGWRVWLVTLRLAVFAALAVILFNPQERSQKTAYRPSRIDILFDTSLSSSFPESVPDDATATAPVADTISRAEAVKKVFADSPLIKELQKKHEIKIVTFDSELSPPQYIFPSGHPKARRTSTPEEIKEGQATGSAEDGGAAKDDPSKAKKADLSKPGGPDWNELLRPRGLETRLGEAVRKLIDEDAGKTLAGIVVVSDGALNAGVDHATANAAAKAQKVRLMAVGVGSTKKQSNLKLAGVQAPTDVHVGDPYEITAYIQGQGLTGRSAEVELLVSNAGDETSPPQVVEKREVAILEDGIPVDVKFSQNPNAAAKLKYTVRTKPTARVREADDTDNEESVTITVVDKKTRVLMAAGGPTRDYQFVRNMLYRHNAVKHDVWLQSVLPETAGKVSQESENLLINFPDNAADLFQYDVILAFDVDWRKVPRASLELLNRWVAEESGGLILLPGDVYTPTLTAAGDAVQPVLDLFPVYLSGSEFAVEREADQPWPFVFTREGEDAGFLQLTDDPQTSAIKWKSFEGVYACYPVSAEKAGTTVYSRFADPRANFQGKQPILMASQFYGSGRVVYLATTEFWRLRSMSDDCAEYDRLWTKMIREVGQERLTRGTQRAILMPERDKYYIGQTVRVRARVLDAQFKPMEADSVNVDIISPDRRPLSPARHLERDKSRAGQFGGDFRASLPGKYVIELRIPDTNEKEVKEIDVRVPDVESEHREQNASLLTDLVRDTGGKYLRLEEVEKALPNLLPDQGEEYVVDELRKQLWDRDWLYYLLIGILSLEWLTRKLLRMA